MTTDHKSYSQIASVVLAYWVISISMVFANKYLLGSGSDESDISLFVAWFQCFTTVVSVVIGSYLRGGVAAIPPLSRKILLSKNLVILSVLFVGMLTFNNLCLKHVGVAFFQIARSMTLIFTVIFSALILKKPASLRTAVCCTLVAGGFFLGVDQEGIAGTLSFRGVMYGVTTSLFVSMVGIFTKRTLEIVDKDVVRITFYNNFNATILFIPLCIATNQFSIVFTKHAADFHFWGLLVFSGLLSFLIGWASNMQIDYTSPVTHHISNNTKSVLQTVLAVLSNRDFKPMLWWFSNVMVVTGAFLYAVVKISEQDHEKSSALQTALLMQSQEKKKKSNEIQTA